MIQINKIIENRVKEVANHIINSKDTIRTTAYKFNVSKSTVHKDIHERLKIIDINTYNIIQDIFLEHIKIRHILGGESTRIKYKKIKNGG